MTPALATGGTARGRRPGPVGCRRHGAAARGPPPTACGAGAGPGAPGWHRCAAAGAGRRINADYNPAIVPHDARARVQPKPAQFRPDYLRQRRARAANPRSGATAWHCWQRCQLRTPSPPNVGTSWRGPPTGCCTTMARRCTGPVGAPSTCGGCTPPLRQPTRPVGAWRGCLGSMATCWTYVRTWSGCAVVRTGRGCRFDGQARRRGPEWSRRGCCKPHAVLGLMEVAI